MVKEKLWHNLSWEEVVEKTGSDAEWGLSEKEVETRQQKFGPNKIIKQRPRSPFKTLLEQFKSPLIYILLVVGLVVLFIEDYPQNLIEGGFVFAAVIINAVFGFWKEHKASKTFQKLEEVLKTKAIVVRNGHKKEVFQEEIVVGDIIVLNPGDKVPADGRLFEVKDLKISEAALTGEWLPGIKETGVLKKDTSLADRDNMVYAGSLIENGEGRAVITAIGGETEMGRIALLVKEAKKGKTPLQKKLDRFGKTISVVIVCMAFFIFIGGIIRQQNPIEMFETAAAIAVGGIPEALPIIMTLILAIGMERLARNKGLLKQLASVETLGSTSVICCDKTKTLTQGRMDADRVITSEEDFKIGFQSKNPVYLSALRIAALNNEAFVENPDKSPKNWKVVGSPTDKALLLAGEKSGFLKPDLEENFSLSQKLPFSSSRGYQAGIYQNEGEFFLYISGTPERLLELAKKVQLKDGEREFTLEISDDFKQKLQKLTRQGRRVIGVGYKKIEPREKNRKIEELIKDITFSGFISLKDPLRPDVKEVMKICQKAGLKLIIITGDHRNTAEAVALEIGLKIKEENILEGKELNEMSDEELREKVKQIKIYARAEPKHKIRIVQAWQRNNQVVAMTGDGVNDAPALKKADIGIALGSGTEVAKETSDLVLLDDSFKIIVKAIERGRTILDNLRKAVSYVLADSFTTVILVGTSVILGWPLPILWVQILWNNVVEDTLPNVAYAFEPKEKGVMERKPDSPETPLLTKEMKFLIFVTGLIDEFLILILFWILWGKMGLGLDYVRTMVFGAICLDTAFVIYCYKNLKENIWNINILSNKFLLYASAAVFLTFAAAIYLPPLQILLHTVPLGIWSWLILIGMGILSMFLIEITKWFFIVKDKKSKVANSLNLATGE